MPPTFFSALRPVFNYWSQSYRFKLLEQQRVIPFQRKRFARLLVVDSGLDPSREHVMWAAQLLDASMALNEPHCYSEKYLQAQLKQDAKDKSLAAQEQRASAVPGTPRRATRYNQLKKNGVELRKKREPRKAKGDMPEHCRTDLPNIVVPAMVEPPADG